jgi:hypothetical protein
MLYLAVIAEDPRQGIRHARNKKIPTPTLFNTTDKKNLVRLHLYAAVEELINDLFTKDGKRL